MLGVVKALRVFAPALNWLGAKLDKETLVETSRIAEQLLTLQAEFNDTFAKRGWIASGAINTEAALQALALAKTQRWDEADQVLAASYPASYIRAQLGSMTKLQCFAPRMTLARLALDDYEAGRYHACVPVTLALIDGTAKDLTGAGVFRANLRVKPKESFLEIGPGIASLFTALSAPRMITSTSTIAIPFRHGIIHGTDLGYANSIVAAKAWAALLALGHYAKDFLEPPPKPGPRLMEILREAARTREELDEMEAESRDWQPRDSASLERVYASQQFDDGTPEAAVAAALKAWSGGKWLLLAQASSDAHKPGAKAQGLVSKLKSNLGPPPDRFEVTSVEESWCAGWVSVRLVRGEDAQDLRLRLLKIDETGAWPPKPKMSRRWVLHDLWPLEAIYWSSPVADGEDAG